jgi:SAM-dependent methyltransferase
MDAEPHRVQTPSAWVERWSGRVPPGGRVLDVACGHGRHARYFAGRGYLVEAVDRDAELLAGLMRVPGVSTRCADLEGGPWPYAGSSFAGIVVTNYLYRPLFPYLLSALSANGVLIYETFAAGNECYGRPANPNYLLEPGELLDLTRDKLRILAYEDLFVAEPKPAMVQRICAINACRE